MPTANMNPKVDQPQQRWRKIVIAGPDITDHHVAAVIGALTGVLPPDARIWTE